MTIIKNLKHSFTKYFIDPPDVYTAINPLYNLCSFFGLAPYNLMRLENGRKIFKFSWFPIIKNTILALLCLAFVAYNIIFEKKSFRSSSSIEQMRYFQEVVSTLLSCCAMIFGCIFSVKIIQVFKNIDEIDISFRSLAVWVPYKGVYIRVIMHLSLLFLLMGLMIVDRAFIVSHVYENQVLDLYSGLTTFITILMPYFINLLMELQYCHYLYILRIRYKLLNEYLEALVHENKTYNGWIDGEISTIEDPKKLKTETKSGEKKIPKSMMAISDPVFIVDQVAALHIKLTDTAHMINYAFCVQQLLRITVAFISIVAALFLIAINFSRSSAKDKNKQQLDYFFTAWAFSNACEVMTIVWITSETCEEANTCPRILHKIRNNTNNINLQDTIEIYSLQMYHNRLSFTVCGLFPLDYTLLYTIVAGVTTYLVILIQFNNADFVKNPSNSSLEALNATLNATVN